MKIVIILWKTPFFEMLPDHSPVTSLNLLDLKFFFSQSVQQFGYGSLRESTQPLYLPSNNAFGTNTVIYYTDGQAFLR